MAFSNPITGGQGTLVRPAIKSPDFVTGSTGWSINKDGSAEFNDVVIRGGTVVSGEALYYNGTPGAGTLILAISANGGTDPFGNTYPSGISSFGERNGVDYEIQLDRAEIDFSVKGLTHLPGFVAFNKIDPTTFELFMSSGRINSSYQQSGISLVSESSPTANDSYMSFQAEKVQALGRFTAPNIQFGRVSIPGHGGTPQWTQTTVTFPQPFDVGVIPRVILTPISGASAASTTIDVATDNITRNGFEARMNRSTNTATSVDWFAISS